MLRPGLLKVHVPRAGVATGVFQAVSLASVTHEAITHAFGFESWSYNEASASITNLWHA